MKKRYYRVIIACGHVGSGKNIEITRYFEASDALHCYICALNMPRSKKKPSSVKLIEPIDIKEYHEGKRSECYNYYLHTYDRKNKRVS